MKNEKELKERLEMLNRKIGVMEWDKTKNQFNPGKQGLYDDLTKERESLQSELKLFDVQEGAVSEEVGLMKEE